MYPDVKLRRKSEINERKSLSDLMDFSYLGSYDSIYFCLKSCGFCNNFAVFATYVFATYMQ